MSRTRFLDTLFWASLTSAAAGLVVAAGCANLDRAGEALTTPGPTGATPLEDLVDSIPQVVANPLNVSAWAKIVGTVTIAVGAFFGARKVKTARRARKAAKAVKTIGDAVIEAAKKS